jgi:hypothetical protein
MSKAIETAREFLLERLAKGPVQVMELFDGAERHGITRMTLRRAKKELNLRARKTWQTMDGSWTWEMPGGSRGSA